MCKNIVVIVFLLIVATSLDGAPSSLDGAPSTSIASEGELFKNINQEERETNPQVIPNATENEPSHILNQLKDSAYTPELIVAYPYQPVEIMVGNIPAPIEQAPKDEGESLDTASSIVFMPYFKYKKTVGQRRRVYRYPSGSYYYPTNYYRSTGRSFPTLA